MISGFPICLHFVADVPSAVRARMEYAFRVFAAVFGHCVVDCDTTEDRIHFHYGRNAGHIAGQRIVAIPARYRPRDSVRVPPAPVPYRFCNEDFHLFFGLDQATQSPDWLGEIFEWLSSSQEMDSPRRDSIGRIPYSETVFSRYRLSAREPHVLKLMSWLEAAAAPERTSEVLPKPPSPVPGVEHLVVCSHDIDFYYTGLLSAAVRLLKNLVIAFHIYRSWDFFRWNVLRVPQLLFGQRVGAYLPPLLEASEKHGFQSTLFVVSKRIHRRDPNYTLRQVAPLLLQSRKKGLSVALHGSYESIIERHDLRPEVASLSEAIQERPLGGRQHYLRYDSHKKLFNAIEQAGLYYDSSLGFADTVGFRQGASFAFPPYDFDRECAHDFLELPLALMDGGLEAVCRSSREDPCLVAEAVLQSSRRWGWGGIALDWHNPIEPIQVPTRVNDAFWHCLGQKDAHKERWVSGDQFLQACLSRYQDAGLLLSLHTDA